MSNANTNSSALSSTLSIETCKTQAARISNAVLGRKGAECGRGCHLPLTDTAWASVVAENEGWENHIKALEALARAGTEGDKEVAEAMAKAAAALEAAEEAVQEALQAVREANNAARFAVQEEWPEVNIPIQMY